MMRKPNKAKLEQIFTQGAHNLELISEGKIVVDGGALLHQVRWNQNSTYNTIMNQYRRYLDTVAKMFLMATILDSRCKIMNINAMVKYQQHTYRSIQQ